MAVLPFRVPSANLVRVHSIPQSRLVVKILYKFGPSWNPWGMLQVTNHYLDFKQLASSV